MNTSFVFLRPEVCTKATVELTLNFFEQANIRVDDIAVIDPEEARRHDWIDKHYATTQTFAFADSAELPQLIENRSEIKSVFHAFFHELWDTVVAEGRLLSAKDAMAVLGNLSPQELSQRWWGNGDFHPPNTTTALGFAPVKLFHGFYVMRLAQEGNLYIVNGFYPAIHERCTTPVPGASLCRLTVSWPESAYTWEQFAAEVIGRAGDPHSGDAVSATYPATCLRHALYHQSEALGVHMVKDAWAAPSRTESAPVVMSGLEAAAGPLEALAARCHWTNLSPEADDFGRQLLQEGVPLSFVYRLLENPVLLQSGEVIAAFDVTAGLTTSQAVRFLSELFVEHTARQQERAKAAPGTEDKPGALYILDVVPSSSPDTSTTEEAPVRDTAVLLVKPHACKPRVVALVEEALQRQATEHGLTIDAAVDIDGELAGSENLVERQYCAESFYATTAEPAGIPVSAAAQEAFHSTFAVQWKDMVNRGCVFTAAAALHLLGGLTPAQLYQQWFLEEEKHRKLKLCGGAWVCRVPGPKPHPQAASSGKAQPAAGEMVSLPTEEPFFVINGFYPYLRQTLTTPGARTRCYALSWPEQSEEAEKGKSFGTARLDVELRGRVAGMLKAEWQSLGLAHPPDSVNNAFVLSRGAAEAAAMRHVWLGTPLEDDVLYQQVLRPRGVSAAPLMRWLANPLVRSAASPEKQRVMDLLAGECTSEVAKVARETEQQLRDGAEKAAVNRAVVLLYPPAATAKAIQHVRTVLSRGGIAVKAEGDVFAKEASARLLGTANMRGAARLSTLAGEALFDAVSHEAREAFQTHFKKDWAQFAEIITGATVACQELDVTPTALMKKWSDCDPVRLGRQCHVAFVPAYQRYIVNGFYPYLEERYTSPVARTHYFHVEWKESRWTWADFSNIVVGNADIASAAAGSLQRSISEGWRELGLPERPCHRAQVSITASAGPLEAIADRAVWPAEGELTKGRLEDRLLADVVAQRLVAEGVPSGTVAYYAAGHRGLLLDQTRSVTRELLREVSTHQQTSECVRRLKTVSASIQSACRQHYAFFWLQPASAKPDFAAVIPDLLAAHNVHIRSCGELSVDEAQEKALLNGPRTALYRNAWVREAAEIPMSAAEKQGFLNFFGISWETAVQLSTVINAKEAARRFGETHLLRWWDETPRKVCLSPSLYVGFLELEGVYVVNGFYPYLQSHLHTGSRRTMWFSVTWDAAQMTWEDFQERVIGAEDPAQAAEGSLRQHLYAHWEVFGLSAPPDTIENGVQASASPIEAVADRCLWWNQHPEQDVLGHLLLQQGVDADFLDAVLENPPVYARGAVGTTVESIADAFGLLPRDPVALAQALRTWQSGTDVALLPSAGATITSPRPLPLPVDNPPAWEEVPTEAQQREALVARQSVFATTAYHALPVSALTSQPLVDYRPAQQPTSGPATDAYAVVTLSPTFLAGSEANAAVVCELVRDLLGSHGVAIAYHGVQSHRTTEERRLFDKQHRRLLRYAMQDSAADLVAVREYRDTLERVFGDAFDVAGLHNVVRLAEVFDLTPHKVNAVWKYCSPIVRLDDELFVGKVPAEDLFVVNGFALHERNLFYADQSPKHFLLVHWDEARLSYSDFSERVIGDSYAEHAAAGSINAALRDGWERLGFPAAPHPFLGAVHASHGALAAMHDRQAWLPQGISFDKDPLGRRAMEEAGVSPYILHWALANPREEPGNGSFAVGKSLASVAVNGAGAAPARLMDVMAGQGSEVTLRLLSSLEVNYRHQQENQQHAAVRNTAFVLVKPHALGRRFGRCVEKVFAKHKIRIDEEGDMTGTFLHEKNLLRALYPAVAAYAVRKPQEVVLSNKEKYFIEKNLGVAWPDMVFGGLVYNAYDALEKLGGVTPQQLYVCWRVSRRRMLVRPDLELTFLDGHGIYVVNGYFPALKQSFESPNALLHWYVVSWPESELTWTQFQSDVVGDEDPAEAAGGTIRGLLQAHWRRYGLHTMPDRIQNGLHVSSGPWHAMAERLLVVQPELERDPLGDLLLRRKVHRGLLMAWLENPDVVACGVTAGIFEHLAGYDTTQVANLVMAVSDNVRKIEKDRKATHAAAPDSTSGEGSAIEAVQTPESALMHPPPTSAELDVVRAGQHNLGDEDTAYDGEDAQETPGEAAVAHRNTALILVKPSVANSAEAQQLLRETLKKHRGVRILSETGKDGGSAAAATARIINQMYFTEAYYGLHSDFAAAADAGGPEFASSDFHTRFAEAFGGEDWSTALSEGRVCSAAVAMQRLRLTAQDLYNAYDANAEAVLRLGSSLSFTKVVVDAEGDTSEASPRFFYVANADYPLVREHLQYDFATGSEADEMRALVVAWDERELSWKDFKKHVIGAEDPACASPESFRGQLLQKWNELGLAAPPTLLDNGVRVSDGPLQAYAERIAWFGNTSGAIPDTLARCFAAADADAAVLLEWSENPLVDLGNGTSVRRLFDLFLDADTADVIAFAKAVQDGGDAAPTTDASHEGAEAEAHSLPAARPVVLATANNLHPYQATLDAYPTLIARRPCEDRFHPQVPRHDPTTHVDKIEDGTRGKGENGASAPEPAAPVATEEEAAVDVPTATFSHRGSACPSENDDVTVAAAEAEKKGGDSAQTTADQVSACEATPAVATVPAPTVTTAAKPRQRLQAAKVRDALLYARTMAEVQQLWDYYVELDRAKEGAAEATKKAAISQGMVGGRRLAAAKPTIDSAAFKDDFSTLEMFGAPLPKHQVKSLFAPAEARGGRMNFDEFARALASYQAM